MEPQLLGASVSASVKRGWTIIFFAWVGEMKSRVQEFPAGAALGVNEHAHSCINQRGARRVAGTASSTSMLSWTDRPWPHGMYDLVEWTDLKQISSQILICAITK